jgi:hypothetical protein
MKTNVMLVVCLLVGCGGAGGGPLLTTPRSPVPSPLQGPWFTGTLSSIQYYDRNTGQFQNPNGSGFYFIFEADGVYETGAVIDSTVSGCNMRLLGSEFGTVTIEGPKVTKYRHKISVKVTNTCGNDAERVQGEELRVMTWSVDRDEGGLEWLSLTHDDGSVEKYRRWAQPN